MARPLPAPAGGARLLLRGAAARPGRRARPGELGGIALDETRWRTRSRTLRPRALARDAESGRAHFGRGLALACARAHGRGRGRRSPRRASRPTTSPWPSARSRGSRSRAATRAPRSPASRAAESSNAALADLPALRAAAHRLLGEHESALRVGGAGARARPDALHGRPREEARARGPAAGRADEWEAVWRGYMRDSVQNQLELAADYLESGLAADAEAVLTDAAARAPAAPATPSPFSAQRTSPMVDYLLGLASRCGAATRAAPARLRARGRAAARVREPAPGGRGLRARGRDSREPAGRPRPSPARQRALRLRAPRGRPRALAGGHAARPRVSRSPGATSATPSTSSTRTTGPRPRRIATPSRPTPPTRASCSSSTRSQERLRVPPPERLALLDAHRPVVDRRDDLVMRWIDLKLAAGAPAGLEAVRDVLLTRHFHSWEGLYGIHHAFVEVQPAARRSRARAQGPEDRARALPSGVRVPEEPRGGAAHAGLPRAPRLERGERVPRDRAEGPGPPRARRAPRRSATRDPASAPTTSRSPSGRSAAATTPRGCCSSSRSGPARSRAGANGRGGRSEAVGEYLLVAGARGQGRRQGRGRGPQRGPRSAIPIRRARRSRSRRWSTRAPTSSRRTSAIMSGPRARACPSCFPRGSDATRSSPRSATAPWGACTPPGTRKVSRVVAVKTIKGELLTSDTAAEYLRRFRREAVAAGALNHPRSSRCSTSATTSW